MPKVILY
ncbi:uncharacterized protein FFM5_15318 [Fusarium fujikuroi]|nr:uncharacterized protein FFM5_15318 [Fusarium fujikuroi]